MAHEIVLIVVVVVVAVLAVAAVLRIEFFLLDRAWKKNLSRLQVLQKQRLQSGNAPAEEEELLFQAQFWKCLYPFLPMWVLLRLSSWKAGRRRS
jgi:NADH:ubiquinone oxidoreductase subunit 3 (subunit A)